MITKYIIFALVLDGLIRNKDSEKWEKMKNIFIFKITTSKMVGAIEDNGEINIIAIKSENNSTFKIIDPKSRIIKKLCDDLCKDIRKQYGKDVYIKFNKFNKLS